MYDLTPFVITGSIIFTLLPSVFCSSGGKKAVIERKPNIILINIDDMGWRDVGFMGSEYYETPNIDELARQGMIFNQAYAAASNCAPSRACMMTGQWTPRQILKRAGYATCHAGKWHLSDDRLQREFETLEC